MQEVTTKAGMSVATGYRYFSSVDELLADYVREVVEALRATADASQHQGKALFEELVRARITLLREHGRVMVQLRSRKGFLQRLTEQDPIITAVEATWEPALTGVLQELGLGVEHRLIALFLFNVMFDPREIADLLENLDLGEEKLAAQLVSTYYSAVEAWVDSSGSEPEAVDGEGGDQ